MGNQLTAKGANALESEGVLVQRLLAMTANEEARVNEQSPVKSDDNFFTRLVAAAEATLDNWSLSILNARYGLFNRRSMTVDEIAIYSGLTAEMVRAHIDSALERLNEQGQREILEGRVDEPCARLVLYVRAAVRPEEAGATARLMTLTYKDLSHLEPLLDLPDLLALFTKEPDEQHLRSIMTRLQVLEALQSGVTITFQSEYGPAEEQEFSGLLAGVEWPPAPARLSLSEIRQFEPGLPDEETVVVQLFSSTKSNHRCQFTNSQVFNLLCHLEYNEQVVYYTERPLRVPNPFTDEGEPNFVEPSHLMALQDGRVVLIDMTPPGEVVFGLHSSRRLALRLYCMQHGYGLLVTDGRDTALSHSQWLLPSDRGFLVTLSMTTGLLTGEPAVNLGDLNLTHREMCGLVARENLVWLPGTHAVSTRLPGANRMGEVDELDEEASEMEPEDTFTDSKVADGADNLRGGSQLMDLLVNAVGLTLDEREGAIFMARFGLEDGHARTLSAVGDQFGITRERARQIIEKGFQRLTRAAKSARRRARYDEPCARLADYIRSAVNPDADDDAERLLALMRAELPQLRTLSVRDAAMLPARFLGDKETAADYAKRVRELVEAEQEVRREEKEVARSDAKLDALLRDVIWPPEIRLIAPGDFGTLAAARSVSPHMASETGAFASGKLDRLVEYESALEHDFLQLLEGTGNVGFYQEQPFRVPYEADGQVHHTYPDVFFVLGDGRGVVAEVTPNFEMAQEENWVKWHGLRVFCRERGYGLLITDGRRTFQSVSRHEVRLDISHSLLAALDEGPMSWPDYQAWRDKSGITTGEFYAIVIQERLKWQLRPYRLARG